MLEVSQNPDHAGKNFLKELQKEMPELEIADVPSGVLFDGFYQMGATGLSALIQLSLQQADLTDEDMQGIAVLSLVRHHVFQMNALPA